MHVVGLEEVQAEASTPTVDVDKEKEELKARIRELEQTVRLEGTSCST